MKNDIKHSQVFILCFFDMTSMMAAKSVKLLTHLLFIVDDCWTCQMFLIRYQTVTIIWLSESYEFQDIVQHSRQPLMQMPINRVLFIPDNVFEIYFAVSIMLSSILNVNDKMKSFNFKDGVQDIFTSFLWGYLLSKMLIFFQAMLMNIILNFCL